MKKIRPLIKIVLQVFTPLKLAILVFLFFQLRVFNLGLAWRDEGFLALGAIRINRGEIPYKDFFLTLTPGSFYVQALLMKVFGNYLIIDRILYILLVVLLLFIVAKIFSFTKLWNCLFLISLAFIFLAPGGFAFYNLEGLVVIMLGFLVLQQAVFKNSARYYFLAGFLAAMVYLFKQTYGLFTIAAFFGVIVLYAKERNRLPSLLRYSLGLLIGIVPALLYFRYQNVLRDFIYYTLIFSRSVKSHQLNFVLHRLVFIPVFLVFIRLMIRSTVKKRLLVILLSFGLGLIYLLSFPERIGRLTTYLTDPLFYFYTIIFLLPLVIIGLYLKPKNQEQKSLVITAIALLGLFLASACSGYDYAMLIVTSPLLVPLVISFARRFVNPLFLAGLIIGYVVFLAFPGLKEDYKVFGFYPRRELTENLNLPEAKYLKVSLQNKQEIETLASYLKKRVPPDQKIFCFPYCPMLLVLTDRASPSYFNFFYFEMFRAQDQEKVIADLLYDRTKLIVVQTKGDIEPEAEYENQRLQVLKIFIDLIYREELATQNFKVYSNKWYP